MLVYNVVIVLNDDLKRNKEEKDAPTRSIANGNHSDFAVNRNPFFCPPPKAVGVGV
jgi:hypothetical protein